MFWNQWYRKRSKRILDEQAVLAQKLDDATEKGREEGILIGHQKGRAEGKEEGIKIGAERVAKNLLKASVSVDLIAESTGLPQAEITQLKEETF